VRALASFSIPAAAAGVVELVARVTAR
jgi:hypothetical protein